ncbi:MAG: hypothetical protein LBP54_00455 [Campylobacteraceae bacterium]|jgi:phage regulator Rha-like protein|nr:hypothetical protein [Campylobacteraceae bacterium]
MQHSGVIFFSVLGYNFIRKVKIQLITLQSGIPVVSHRVITEYTGNEQKSIVRLIDTHKADFEEFGRVGFEIATLQTNGGEQETKTYFKIDLIL